MLKEAFLKAFKKDYLKTVSKHLNPSVRKALVKENAKEGLGLAGMAAHSIAKGIGKKRSYHKILKKIHEKPLKADTYIGSKLNDVMEKMPIGKNLFKMKENVKISPKVTKKVNGKRVTVQNERFEVHERPSALAPLSKATEIAKPVVFGLAVDKVLKDNKKRKDEQKHQ